MLQDGPVKAIMVYHCFLCGTTAHFAVQGEIIQGTPNVSTPEEAHEWAKPHVVPRCVKVLLLT